MNPRESTITKMNLEVYRTILIKVADPHHFNADPDLAFHLNANADPDPAPHQVLGICDHWSEVFLQEDSSTPPPHPPPPYELLTGQCSGSENRQDTVWSCLGHIRTQKAKNGPNRRKEKKFQFHFYDCLDILVRIRIRGSVPLTYGSSFGSGSSFFHQWHSRCQKFFFLF